MGRYTDVAEVRFAPDLSDSNVVSDDIINLAISATEESFDNFTHVSFSSQTKDYKVEGSGDCYLTISTLYLTAVNSVKIGTTTVSTEGLKVLEGSKIYSPLRWEEDTIYTLNITYGYSSVPSDIKYIAALEAQRRTRVILSKAKQRGSGTQVANEHGQYTYPNWSGKFGPSDDAEVLRILKLHAAGTNARFSV